MNHNTPSDEILREQPQEEGATAPLGPTDDEAAESTRQRIRQLPPEVGAVLMGVGLLGVILPGPFGTPLILAGGLVLVPGTFGKMERWVQKRFPRMHRSGMKYVDRFIDDFEKRYPPKP
ncbi:MAG: hypothetical protein ACKV0T_14475 [Planctomycetales bacterium]